MANEILRASDGKNYVPCVPDNTFDAERLAKPSQLPKFGDISNSAKANLPDISLSGLTEAENALLQFGGSNSRKLQMLADLVEHDGGKAGEVTLEDLNEALSRDRNGMQRLNPEDKRAIQWMKNNMTSIADEDTIVNDGWAEHAAVSVFQGLDLWDDDGISAKELTAYAGKRGATLKGALAAREQLERNGAGASDGEAQSKEGKQETRVKEGTTGKQADGRQANQEPVDDASRNPQDKRVYGYSSLSDLPGVAQRVDGKVGTEAADRLADSADSSISVEDNGVVDYTVKKGDSISNVASRLLRESLGRAVTQAELRNYVSKVVAMNGLGEAGRRADLIFPGEVLRLPPLCEVPNSASDDKLA